jgi:hypothetical protein
MFSWQHKAQTISRRAILILSLVAVAAGPITACSGDMMEAKPVCIETFGAGGPQIVPMYRCEGGHGGKLVNK